MSEKKPIYKRKWFIGIMIFLVLAAIGGMMSDDEETPQENAAGLEIEVEELEEVLAEEIEEDIDAVVKNIIIDNLGEKTNMKHDRIVEIKINDHLGTEKEGDKIALITLVANENLTNNMTKSTIHKDSTKVLQELYSHDEIEEVVLFWQLPLTDTYGNEKIDNVMKVTIDRSVAEKINWNNFDYNNIPKVANDYWEHPAFNN